MDILTHALSGIAAGTAVSCFSSQKYTRTLLIAAMSGFAGVLPDLDAISLWSKFDSTIGSFFNLAASGKTIYSAHYWYSHHGFMHSVLAGIFFALLMGFSHYMICFKHKSFKAPDMIAYLGRYRLVFAGFLLGYYTHLLGDIPTPASSWGGVNLFWPSKTYIGGTGHIWWWNNYDIFIIVLSMITANTILLLSQKRIGMRLCKRAASVIAVAGFALVLSQIASRTNSYAYSGHTPRYAEMEAQSKEEQKRILGDKVFGIMEVLDKHLKIYF